MQEYRILLETLMETSIEDLDQKLAEGKNNKEHFNRQQ